MVTPTPALALVSAVSLTASENMLPTFSPTGSNEDHDLSESSAQAPASTDNINTDEVNAALKEEYFPLNDPDAVDLFDPSQFSEDTIKYVHTKVR